MNATPTTTSHSLKATERILTGKKVRQLRSQGLIPAVVYGHQQESYSITLNEREFGKLYREAGTSTLIDLSIEGKKSHKVLVHDIQMNPIKNTIKHVDFYQVNMKEKLRTEVPLEFTGISPAVELEGGSLLIIKDAVEVECLPENLIQEIVVDISVLKSFDDAIRVKDLVVPSGITLLDDEDGTIASVSAPRSEEELEELSEKPDATLNVEIETESGTEAASPEKEG